MKLSRSHSPSPTSSPIMERTNNNGVEKLKPKVQKVILAQLEELLNTERRCDSNIREMEKMLMIMKREKEDISVEREKLENMTRDIDQEFGCEVIIAED